MQSILKLAAFVPGAFNLDGGKAMKRTLKFLLAVSALCVAGCASAPMQVANDDDIDYQKVMLVNQWALHHNVAVYWVNYPRKASSTTQ